MMTRLKGINDDLDAFLQEWSGKLAWAPYARVAGMAPLDDDPPELSDEERKRIEDAHGYPDGVPYATDIDWADVPGTDEHEMREFEQAALKDWKEIVGDTE